MGWLMTIPQALQALLVALSIGLLGGWLRRMVMRNYRRDLTGWLALASAALFALAATAFYWPFASYLSINSALIFALLSSFAAFLSLGASTLGRSASPVLMGALYCLLALPLIAAYVVALFAIAWVGMHLNSKF